MYQSEYPSRLVIGELKKSKTSGGPGKNWQTLNNMLNKENLAPLFTNAVKFLENSFI